MICALLCSQDTFSYEYLYRQAEVSSTYERQSIKIEEIRKVGTLGNERLERTYPE